MKFCPNCGTQLETGAQFCTTCGRATGRKPAPRIPAWLQVTLTLAATGGALIGVAALGIWMNEPRPTETREYGTATAQLRGEQLQRIEFGAPDPDCTYAEKRGKIEHVELSGRVVNGMTIRFDDGFAEQIDLTGLELSNADRDTMNAAARQGRTVRAGISYCGNGGIPEYNWIEFR
jgi:hypothetical protein